jgi:hypothetical protein
MPVKGTKTADGNEERKTEATEVRRTDRHISSATTQMGVIMNADVFIVIIIIHRKPEVCVMQ